MKRIICLMLVVLMIGALLVSCGDKKEPGKEPGKEPSTQTPPTTTPPTPTTPTTNWYDSIKFPTGTTITIQLSEYDDPELANGHRKYMQGPADYFDIAGDGGFEAVQNEVLRRNDDTKLKLGLDVNYVYINSDWGAGIVDDIAGAEAAGVGNTPDVYSDQMYDMAYLSIQHGIFSNILKYTQTNRQNVKGWKEGAGYFHISTTNGYNVQLMDDMALTKDKQFLIASDYFVDVMRAMLVMPFNLKMYEGEVDSSETAAADLYQLVKDGKWTWDVLLSYGEAVYDGSGKANKDSEMMLMPLSIGGLPAVGFVYSSALVNFEYKNGEYTLKESDSEIVKAFESAAKVARHTAVACDDDLKGNAPAVKKCKEIFTSGRALFAGPQMLGAVEETNFMTMEKLSILPVPKNNTRSTYNTTINTRARVGAISFHSPLKKQASAWVQLSTENSDVVKKEYFDKAMNSKYLAGSGANEMLDLIYKNVGSNKSMILDHLILHKNGDMEQHTWTSMIQAGNYQGHETDIGGVYSSAVQAKQSVLDDILQLWQAADGLEK